MTAALPEPLTTQDARAAWGCCVRATPYQRGFEDVRYDAIYANPYRVQSAAWRAYERGAQDARKQGRGVTCGA